MARAAGVALGVAAVALSARLTIPVPGSSVPQSAQTLAVVLLGVGGARWAGATLGAYVLVGILGLPVFSDGGSGWSHFVGPTGGYLVGFVLAGVTVGRFADAGALERWPPALGAMLLGHAVVLALGWAWLALQVGAGAAYESGVAPFLGGGVVKSAIAASFAVAWARRRARATLPTGGARSILAPPPADGGCDPAGGPGVRVRQDLPGRTS